MVVGVTVQCCAFRADCGVDRANLLAGALMYASYLALFVKFALDRFLFKKFGRGGIASTFAGQSAPSRNYWKDPFPTITYCLSKLNTGMRKALSWEKLAQP